VVHWCLLLLQLLLCGGGLPEISGFDEKQNRSGGH